MWLTEKGVAIAAFPICAPERDVIGDTAANWLVENECPGISREIATYIGLTRQHSSLRIDSVLIGLVQNRRYGYRFIAPELVSLEFNIFEYYELSGGIAGTTLPCIIVPHSMDSAQPRSIYLS